MIDFVATDCPMSCIVNERCTHDVRNHDQAHYLRLYIALLKLICYMLMLILMLTDCVVTATLMFACSITTISHCEQMPPIH